MLAKLTSVCYITRYANGKNKTTNRELRQIPAGIRTCCHTQKGLRRLLTFSMASTITAKMKEFLRIVEMIKPSRFITSTLRWSGLGRPMKDREKMLRAFFWLNILRQD